MKILFLTPPTEDYLADGLLHGLKTLFGNSVVDYPKRDVLYKSFPENRTNDLYGRGFTLYRLLDDEPVDRFDTESKLRSGFFDLVVVGNVWKCGGWLAENHHLLNPDRTVVLDGADSPQAFPYAGFWMRRGLSICYGPMMSKLPYFKREWDTESTHFNHWHRMLPRVARKLLRNPAVLRRISFSIPEEKIIRQLPQKLRKFPSHIVDSELSEFVGNADTAYRFHKEADYYADLQASRFGITVKRSGWDCLRHYELAANGAVPCFRNLKNKPVFCAPHDLNKHNSIAYSSAVDLIKQISELTDQEYEALQMNALKWVKRKTTTCIAQEIVETVCTKEKRVA